MQTPGALQPSFGVREDGSLVIGYIGPNELTSKKNPLTQLISGVGWLVRNGRNNVRESVSLESQGPSIEETGSLSLFAEIISARTAIGFDARGVVKVVQIDGKSYETGLSLYQFADVLIKHGLVNAINLDGGRLVFPSSMTYLEDLHEYY